MISKDLCVFLSMGKPLSIISLYDQGVKYLKAIDHICPQPSSLMWWNNFVGFHTQSLCTQPFPCIAMSAHIVIIAHGFRPSAHIWSMSLLRYCLPQLHNIISDCSTSCHASHAQLISRIVVVVTIVTIVECWYVSTIAANLVLIFCLQ